MLQQQLSHCLCDICYLINLSKSTCLKPNSRSPPFKSAAPKSSPAQSLANNPILPISQAKILGIILDPYLSFTYLMSTFCLQTTLSTLPAPRSKPPSPLTWITAEESWQVSQFTLRSTILNTAVKAILDKLKSDHVPPWPKTLPWLPIPLKAGPAASQQPKRPCTVSLASSSSTQPPTRPFQPHWSPYPLNTASQVSSQGLRSDCCLSSRV